MAFNLADFPEALVMPEPRMLVSAWLAHIPLTPVIMKLLRPRTFVELGAWGGHSYLAFCKAVKDLGLETQCTAIDTWEGDAHTGKYGPEILNDLKSHHDPAFAGFSQLMKSTFNDAVGAFADRTIDLLHIDGAHTYEAVRHDWESWQGKLSERGVVILHDTAERDQGFGVWRLWEEISAGRPSVNLPYGHGLGIMAVGAGVPAAFLEFLFELHARPQLVRIFQTLGERVQQEYEQNFMFHCLYESQVLINHWRQNTQQPIRNPSPDVQAAKAASMAFSQANLRDVHELVTDALNLVAEIMKMRESKAG
jgi:hypothetical protein